MAVEYVGGLTVGETVPGVGGALAAATADLEAKAAALASFTPTVALTLDGQLQLALQILAAAEAAIAAGIQPPSLDVQLNLVAALLVDVRASLQILVDLAALFGAAGVHAYHYSGRADDLGGEFATELAAGFPAGAPSDATEAILLATTVPACWAAMAQVFKVAP